jgi:hypothetical protein
MKFSRKLMLLAVVSAYAGVAFAGVVSSPSNAIYKPTGKGYGELDLDAMSKPGLAAAVKGAATGNLTNHGGPVMTAAKKIYYIWYGTWDAASKNVLTNFGQNIGGSPYFNINTTYTNTAGTKLLNSVTLAGSSIDTGSLGTRLSDANIQSIVSSQITSGKLPLDANGIYFVLTDKNTTATSGFCTQYCGWHTNATISGQAIKYSFVGNPETQCPTGCGANSPSPNGTPGADAMASVLAHELEETATDPLGNAWYASSDGQENGDKCNFNFGTTSTASNGAKYNQTFGTLKYLIQQNWLIASTQKCVQHYP